MLVSARLAFVIDNMFVSACLFQRYFIRNYAYIIFTEASGSLAVIVHIRRPNMPMSAIVQDRARKAVRKQRHRG
jgi:hypothetical protein